MGPSHSIQIQIDVPVRSEGGFGAKVSYCACLKKGVSCNVWSWTLALFQKVTAFPTFSLG